MAGNIPGVCITGTPYTGNERCPKSERQTIALELTDPAARYPVDEETFNSELNGYVVTKGINRIYPISGILSNELSGGDVTTSDVGFSGSQPISTAQVTESYQIDGSDCLYKELSKFNGRKMRVFRVDADNYIYGTILTRDGVESFAGFMAYIWVRRVKSTGTDNYQLFVDVYYSNTYDSELKNLNAFALSEIPEGLVAVRVESVTGGLQVVGNCSGVDYTTTYGEEWASDMFINSSGEAATAVVYSENTGLLTITPTGTYRVADASVLQAGGIYGITGIPLN